MAESKYKIKLIFPNGVSSSYKGKLEMNKSEPIVRQRQVPYKN